MEIIIERFFPASPPRRFFTSSSPPRTNSDLPATRAHRTRAPVTLRTAVALSLLLHGPRAADAAELLADVVVYGSTPAGCAAAVAAAREGASVLLLTPDQHLGGMLTSGYCVTDPGPFRSGVLAGFAWEWHWRLAADHRQRGLKLDHQIDAPSDLTPWTFEPQAALRVTRQLLDEAGVLLLTGRRLEAAILDGPRLLRLHTTEGEFKGKVFIDATYEADLTALCGIRFQSEPTTDASSPEPVADLLPFVLCLTSDSAQKVALPAPGPTLDPLLLEDLRAWLIRHPDSPPWWTEQTLPGGKIAVQFDLSGPLAHFLQCRASWCQADAATRAWLWEEQRQRVLALCRFLASDPSVPRAWRERWSLLGLPRDEFIGNAHWPPLLPLREGRRLAAASPFTEADALVAASDAPDTIALCPSPGIRPPAWPVPLRVLLPPMDAGENLLTLAAPATSAHLATALRREAVLMTLGQSAGIAAGIASQQEEVLPLAALDLNALRARLTAQGVVLRPPERPLTPPAPLPAPAEAGQILDDTDAEFVGPWRFSRHLHPHHGKGYHHDNRGRDGECLAHFRLQVPETGRYELRLAYTPGPTRASNVRILIETGGRKARLAFDQTQPPPVGSPFRRLAELSLQADQPVTITLSNQGADGHVIVDGLQLIKASAPPDGQPLKP